MCAESLWGNIPELNEIETPMKILREQAEILSERTGGKLEAKVIPRWKGTSRDGVGEEKHNDDLKELNIDLAITSPNLEKHFVNVLRISHQMQVYPTTMVNFLIYPFEYLTANSADEFKAHLGKVLSSEELKEEIKEMLIKTKLVE